MNEHESMTITVQEAAKLLGISKNLCYDAVARGQIPAVRVGRRLLVPRLALQNLLAETNHDDGCDE